MGCGRNAEESRVSMTRGKGAEWFEGRFLPKVAWVFVVILIPLLGSALWWGLGRSYGPPAIASTRYPDHMQVPVRPVERRSTEQQLADLEREEREEALRAEIARRRREAGLDPA